MHQNRVEIAGNLTRDPEVRYTPKGTAIADLAVALNRPIPPAEEGGEWQQETTYVDVTVFGKTASRCGENLKKARASTSRGTCAWTNGWTRTPSKTGPSWS